MIITEVTPRSLLIILCVRRVEYSVRLGVGGAPVPRACGILIYATELETNKDNEDPWVRAIKGLFSGGLRDVGEQDVQRNYMTMTDVLQVHGF